MPLLVKGVYGCETNSKKTPFGLLNQQFRVDGLLNNAGWFNRAGDKLGFGDLAIHDLHTISVAIPKGESFIVLSEFDTAWDIPSHLDSTSPGSDYVIQNCVWYVCSNAIYRVRSDGKLEEADRDGIKYTRISRQEFYKLIGYTAGKVPEAPAVPKPKLKISDEEFHALLKQVNTKLKANKALTAPATPAPATKTTTKQTIPTPGSGKYIGYARPKAVKTKSP